MLQAPLNFEPTYRMETHNSAYSNKREQSPSWTDRILYKSIAHLEDEFTLKKYSCTPLVFGR